MDPPPWQPSRTHLSDPGAQKADADLAVVVQVGVEAPAALGQVAEQRRDCWVNVGQLDVEEEQPVLVGGPSGSFDQSWEQVLQHEEEKKRLTKKAKKEQNIWMAFFILRLAKVEYLIYMLRNFLPSSQTGEPLPISTSKRFSLSKRFFISSPLTDLLSTKLECFFSCFAVDIVVIYIHSLLLIHPNNQHCLVLFLLNISINQDGELQQYLISPWD